MQDDNRHNKDYSFLWNPKNPLLHFNRIPIDEDRMYEVRILDVFHPDVYKTSSGSPSLVFKVRLLDGFKGIYVEEGELYTMHIPMKCFKIAWEESIRRKVKDYHKVYDCIMTFTRPTRKSMIIMDAKLIEVER